MELDLKVPVFLVPTDSELNARRKWLALLFHPDQGARQFCQANRIFNVSDWIPALKSLLTRLLRTAAASSTLAGGRGGGGGGGRCSDGDGGAVAGDGDDGGGGGGAAAASGAAGGGRAAGSGIAACVGRVPGVLAATLANTAASTARTSA